MESNYQISSASVTDRGLSEKRPQNEDSFLEIPEVGLYAVADGVGGAQAGEVASQMAMEILGEAFVNINPGADAEEVMRVAIERANAAIFQMSGDLAQLSMMATTIVALHISGNVATIGHVGDSRLYRLDNRGSLYRETQDHSVVEEEVRAGRMTAAQAANHPSRNVISRALGAEGTVEVDLKTIMFESGTVFLICSDGVTRHITDFEIRELLLSSPNPALICDRIKAICFDRGAEDNLTAVIVRVAEAAVPAISDDARTTAPLADFEEETVAAVRQEIETPAESELPPTASLEMPAVAESTFEDTDEQYLIHSETEEFVEFEQTVPIETDPTPEMLSFQAESPVSEPEPAMSVEVDSPFSMYADEEAKSGGGFFGKLLGALLWLIVGAAIGAGGYFAYLTYFAPVPDVPALTPKTNNIAQSSVDTLRQDAVTKPAEVIKQYATAPPKDASDFFVLGKAHLYNKNYEEAKKAFIEARNRLKDVSSAENKAALAADITQGLIIAQNKDIQAAFEKELKVMDVAPASNSAANSSREP
ncbi:MAG: protein phosphatase 2C domain-containing protein [Acidobacteria bacterium]|nr:protein phosphatase 2C domain-containing protein [Acidobacteriota bacterium]